MTRPGAGWLAASRDLDAGRNSTTGLRYTDSMPKPSDKLKRIEAESYAAAWRRAGPALDAKRLQALRSLSEEESARCFAELLTPMVALPLRPSSGLVEQQRALAKLRDKHR
jgi:hypothetical protein